MYLMLLFVRSLYHRIREYDKLDKKKMLTALRAGEDRAILLGLCMVLFSVIMYFINGITILRSYSDRWLYPLSIALWCMFWPSGCISTHSVLMSSDPFGPCVSHNSLMNKIKAKKHVDLVHSIAFRKHLTLKTNTHAPFPLPTGVRSIPIALCHYSGQLWVVTLSINN